MHHLGEPEVEDINVHCMIWVSELRYFGPYFKDLSVRSEAHGAGALLVCLKSTFAGLMTEKNILQARYMIQKARTYSLNEIWVFFGCNMQ